MGAPVEASERLQSTTVGFDDVARAASSYSWDGQSDRTTTLAARVVCAEHSANCSRALAGSVMENAASLVSSSHQSSPPLLVSPSMKPERSPR